MWTKIWTVTHVLISKQPTKTFLFKINVYNIYVGIQFQISKTNPTISFFSRCLFACLWTRIWTVMSQFPNNQRRKFKPLLTLALVSFPSLHQEPVRGSELISSRAEEQKGPENKLDSTESTWDLTSYLGVVHKLRWQVFGFFDHQSHCVDIFNGMIIEKKWPFMDHLPTSSCKRSLWTTPYFIFTFW